MMEGRTPQDANFDYDEGKLVFKISQNKRNQTTIQWIVK